MACQRSGDGFAVALVDLDHFERINDAVDALVERADRAIYQAKSQGRDRVVTLPEAATPA